MIRSINTVATPTGHIIYVACDLQGVGHSLWRMKYEHPDQFTGWERVPMPMGERATPELQANDHAKNCQCVYCDITGNKENIELQKAHPDYVEALKTGGFNERSVMVDVEEKHSWVNDLNTGDEVIYKKQHKPNSHFKIGNVYRFQEVRNGHVYFIGEQHSFNLSGLKNFFKKPKEDNKQATNIRMVADEIFIEELDENLETDFSMPFHILKTLNKDLLAQLFVKIKNTSQEITLMASGQQLYRSAVELIRHIYNNGVELSGCIISSVYDDGDEIEITVNKIIKEESKDHKDFTFTFDSIEEFDRLGLDGIFSMLKEKEHVLYFLFGNKETYEYVSEKLHENHTSNSSYMMTGFINSILKYSVSSGSVYKATVTVEKRKVPTEIDLLNARIRELEVINEKLRVVMAQPMKFEVEPVEESFISKSFNKTE